MANLEVTESSSTHKLSEERVSTRKQNHKNVASSKNKKGKSSKYDNASTVAEPSPASSVFPVLATNVNMSLGCNWHLNIPRGNDSLQFRERSELVNLLDNIAHIFREKNFNTYEERAYLHRLSRKIKYRLSSFTIFNICTCLTMSESCVGIIKDYSLSMNFIRCSYTNRMLAPVIFQTYDIKPPWVQIKEDLFNRAVEMKTTPLGDLEMIRRPITFAHITSAHLPAIKCLIDNYFWINVDLSHVLQYPEFSCIVLYGKLVVGFGFLSPGAHRSEGYINFVFVRPHWRRCGIGELILFLLRQQCMLWTLTLHVSPTSEALNLYHKFAFKTCVRIKNFYDGYMVASSPVAKDALFMKLESRLPRIY